MATRRKIDVSEIERYLESGYERVIYLRTFHRHEVTRIAEALRGDFDAFVEGFNDEDVNF